jgi:hypothetical protein
MSIAWNREDQKQYFLMTAAFQPGGVKRTLLGTEISISLQGMIRAVLTCFMTYKMFWLAPFAWPSKANGLLDVVRNDSSIANFSVF